MNIRSTTVLLTLIAALCAATPTTASAQVGALVGFNSAKVDFEGDDDEIENEFVSRRTGFVGGVTFNMPIQNMFSVEVDALVGLKGAKFDFGGVDLSELKTTHLDIPVLARANFAGGTNTNVHVFVGPSFNFKLSEKFEPDDDTSTDDIETFETSIVIGGGVVISRFRVDARWGFGLTNIDSFAADNSSIKSQVFSLLFGFEL